MKIKLINLTKQDIFPLVLILIMVLSRLIPHPPNFTPIIAIAMMSGYFFKSLNFSILILLISMLLSDLFLGLYNNMIFVYASLFIIVLYFFQINKKINYKNLFFLGLGSSLVFFIISNFGVWIMENMYEKNLNGLINCYLLAIPFFKNTFISTLFFSYSAYTVNNLYYKKISY
ncbi:MAG: hypothetical protein H8E55_52240 [Pelagibacterales bacterium]|nr:hypothetical protein [Pelagibacterales bacterium]